MDTFDGLGLDILEDLDEIFEGDIIDTLYNLADTLMDEDNINIGDTLNQRNILRNLFY